MSWLLVRPRQDVSDRRSNWIRIAIAKSARSTVSEIRSATRPVALVGGLLRDQVRSRRELIAENIRGRQPLEPRV